MKRFVIVLFIIASSGSSFSSGRSDNQHQTAGTALFGLACNCMNYSNLDFFVRPMENACMDTHTPALETFC